MASYSIDLSPPDGTESDVLNKLDTITANSSPESNEICNRVRTELNRILNDHSHDLYSAPTPLAFSKDITTQTISISDLADNTDINTAVRFLLHKLTGESRKKMLNALKEHVKEPLPSNSVTRVSSTDDAVVDHNGRGARGSSDGDQGAGAEPPARGYGEWAKRVAHAPMRAASSMLGGTKKGFATTASMVRGPATLLYKAKQFVSTEKGLLRYVNIASSDFVLWKLFGNNKVDQ